MSVLDRDTEHDIDKAMPIQVIGDVIRCMIEKLWHVLKLCPEFWNHSVVDAQEYRL